MSKLATEWIFSAHPNATRIQQDWHSIKNLLKNNPSQAIPMLRREYSLTELEAWLLVDKLLED